ncbi:MAG: DNA methyltransferase [Elusimicrobiota bacterium]|jgi:DNA (cytosine-5)-methyltransferase 1|nr:DNA methyltransferase [Elusimicrobiota bacterium]
MTPSKILETLLSRSLSNLSSKKSKKYSPLIISNIDVLISNIDKNKSLVSAMVTSVLKKICNPEQDIRLHRADFDGGYSARSLDTNITTPFFKKHFPKYANKESGFLSMATRVQIPWTKTDGNKIKTRASKEFMNSFLEILDLIENNKIKPDDTLIYLFEKLHSLSLQQQRIFNEAIETSSFVEVISINAVLSMLCQHFSMPSSSRLPVIAIYSIYEQLFRQMKRYENKVLQPLNVHTSADKHGYGDIEVWNDNNTPFEMVEIKHNLPINQNMLFDIVKKSAKTTIERYYILTTAKKNFVSKKEEDNINKFILKIKKDTEMEIIANGIVTTLKYYLRLIDDYKKFINDYTKNLIYDSKNSTEIKAFHILKWKDILIKSQIR